MTLDDIRSIEKRLADATAGACSEIPRAMKSTPFEMTAAVLTSLVASIGELKDGILTLAECDNLYGMYALFRVFLEHILKAQAIFLKSLDDGSEDFAREYDRLRIKEAFDYLQALKLAGLDISEMPKTILDQWFPEARSLSINKVKELEKPFQYRSLIRLIRELIDVRDPSFLSKIIPNYSELSGFVHGGPTAAAKLEFIRANELRAEEACHVADLAVVMSYSAQRWLLMLAAAMRPEFKGAQDRLDEAMQSIQGIQNSADASSDEPIPS